MYTYLNIYTCDEKNEDYIFARNFGSDLRSNYNLPPTLPQKIQILFDFPIANKISRILMKLIVKI